MREEEIVYYVRRQCLRQLAWTEWIYGGHKWKWKKEIQSVKILLHPKIRTNKYKYMIHIYIYAHYCHLYISSVFLHSLLHWGIFDCFVLLVTVFSIRFIHIHNGIHFSLSLQLNRATNTSATHTLRIVVRSWCYTIYNLCMNRAGCTHTTLLKPTKCGNGFEISGGNIVLHSMLWNCALIFYPVHSIMYIWYRVESMVMVYLAHASGSVCNNCSRLKEISFKWIFFFAKIEEKKKRICMNDFISKDWNKFFSKTKSVRNQFYFSFEFFLILFISKKCICFDGTNCDRSDS